MPARERFPGVTQGRRRNMAAIRSKNTKPEMFIRKELHRRGYRFRLHSRRLPGKPDLVFASRRKIIEVRGCFWHGHGCSLGQIPAARQNYWLPKLEATRVRDAANVAALELAGWSVMECWECDIRANGLATVDALSRFLDTGQSG